MFNSGGSGFAGNNFMFIILLMLIMQGETGALGSEFMPILIIMLMMQGSGGYKAMENNI